MKLAGEQIAQLLGKAEDADSTPLQDGLAIPGEIKRLEDRVARPREATQATELRAKNRPIDERATYEEKLAACQAREQSTGKKPKGMPPAPPERRPP